jgi:hypothetical protein
MQVLFIGKNDIDTDVNCSESMPSPHECACDIDHGDELLECAPEEALKIQNEEEKSRKVVRFKVINYIVISLSIAIFIFFLCVYLFFIW